MHYFVEYLQLNAVVLLLLLQGNWSSKRLSNKTIQLISSRVRVQTQAEYDSRKLTCFFGDSLYRPDWPQTCDPTASASKVLFYRHVPACLIEFLLLTTIHLLPKMRYCTAGIKGKENPYSSTFWFVHRKRRRNIETID
jgi:hypothetical protein